MFKTIFTINGFVPAYIGYTSGRLWNGWATPNFELDVALQLMADYNKETDNPMQYDKTTDTFRIAETRYTDEEVWQGRDCNTDDGIKHLYGIGAYCWIWDAVNDNDRRHIAQEVEEFIFYHDTYQYHDEYGVEREQTVELILEQLKNLEVFHKVIYIIEDETITDADRFEKLGGILTL